MSYIFFFLFFKKNIYLFIWLCRVLVAECRIFVVACGIFSCSMWDLLVAHAGSLVATRGIYFLVAHAGSLVATRGIYFTRDRIQAPCIGSMES